TVVPAERDVADGAQPTVPTANMALTNIVLIMNLSLFTNILTLQKLKKRAQSYGSKSRSLNFCKFASYKRILQNTRQNTQIRRTPPRQNF
ncbi:MAG: hypothetical protein M3Q00_05815, partial [Pseudomonadota bacterium]|nr:hypothetical protein [Pseudomonadota bacterium]